MSITHYSLSGHLYLRKSRNGRTFVQCELEVERGCGNSLASAFLAREKWKVLVFRASNPASSIRKALSCVSFPEELSGEVIRDVRAGRSVLRQKDQMLHRPNSLRCSFSWHREECPGSNVFEPTIRHSWGTEFGGPFWELLPFSFATDWEKVL